MICGDGRRQSSRFALLGVSGFVAERHLQAIDANNGCLLTAADPFDSAGILDRYFHETLFFKDESQFFADLARRQHSAEPIDYLTVCTPNYLHVDQSIRALRHGVSVICEKPLAIDPGDLERLQRAEQGSKGKVATILQLRYHPEVAKLKHTVETRSNRHKVNVNYITPRGDWYAQSWKGDPQLSGGLVYNIGIHLLDLLIWLFGEARQVELRDSGAGCLRGRLELAAADVEWTLSINRSDLPDTLPCSTYRSLTCDGIPLDLSSGFAALHTTCYSEIMQGRGFGIADVRPSLELASRIATLANQSVTETVT